MTHCPECGGRGYVRQTRRWGVNDPRTERTRERTCQDCKHRWWSVEPADIAQLTGHRRPPRERVNGYSREALAEAARLRELLGPPPGAD